MASPFEGKRKQCFRRPNGRAGKEGDGKIFKKDPGREIGGVGSVLRRAQGPQDQGSPAR